MSLKKFLKFTLDKKAQAVMEYIIVFIVIALIITGFISTTHGIFNNYFQALISRVLQ